MDEVITVGEAMLALTPVGADLEHARTFRADVAGAESNVAAHLAALGIAAAWASRVGDDAIGRRLLGELDSRGVDTTLAETDPSRSTGVMFKDPAPTGSAVHYYRSGSAASALSAGLIPVDRLLAARLVHTSGVTAALSESALELVHWLIETVAAGRGMFSFDVNFRRGLWPATEAAGVLADLANRSDLCFVGLDEAESLWGTSSPTEVRTLLHAPRMLVIKDGATGATLFGAGHDPVFSPAPAVDVVEPVGAGDAFAAGFIAALMRGSGADEALRSGHERARLTLLSTADLPEFAA